MRSVGVSLCFGVVLAWCVMPGLLLGAGGEFEIIQLEKVNPSGDPVGPGEEGNWRVTWCSEADMEYRVWRSTDLIEWFEVATVESTTTETRVTDFADPPPPGTRLFWKVELLGPTGEPLDVSDIVASYDLNGATSSALFSLATSGSSPIGSVIFYDNGIALGSATLGLGNVWTFALDWDSSTAEPRSVHAKVMNEEGEMVSTATVRFLLADPTKYVPLDEDGVPLYGEFVSVDVNGDLGAFWYFPEGIGDEGDTTGAHFEFAAGARFSTASASPPPAEEVEDSPLDNPILHFSNAKFYRGHVDESPLSVAGTSASISLAEVTPAGISSAFGIPTSGVQLCWGNSCVKWEAGAMTEEGWGGLQVDLGLGDFGLPDTRLNSYVTSDPETGVFYLVVCYHGSWSPTDGVAFEIPQSDPLKVYFSALGEFSAHGSAEATFPGGTEMRGTLSWREPNFEFSFEGRGIVIPAMGELRQLMSGNPELAVPSGFSAAEIDDALRVLEGYQTMIRGVAVESLGAETATESFPPSASPINQAAVTLEAWAGRFVSWDSALMGSLSDDQLANMTGVVMNAEDSARSSNDLETLLKIYLSLIELRQNRNGVTDTLPGDPEFLSALVRAENAAQRRFEGLLSEITQFDTWSELEAVSVLAAQIAELLALDAVAATPAPPLGGDEAGSSRLRSLDEDHGQTVAASGTPPPVDDFRRALENLTYRAKEGRVVRDFSDATSSEMLDALREMRVFLSFVRVQIGVGTVSGLPPQYAGIQAAFNQIKNVFPRALNAEFAGMPEGDLAVVRRILRSRADFFQLNDQLDQMLASSYGVGIGGFVPSTESLLASLQLALRKYPPAVNAGPCRGDIAMLATLITSTTDRGSDVNAPTIADEIGRCEGGGIDPLLGELQRAYQLVPEMAAPGDEGSMSIPSSGMYESDSGPSATHFETFQLSQAGRLILGRYQEHTVQPFAVHLNKTRTKRLLGMLESDGPGSATFLCVLKADDGSFWGAESADNDVVRLVVTGTPEHVEARMSSIPGASRRQQNTLFRKVSTLAPFSPLVLERFGSPLPSTGPGDYSGEPRELMNTVVKVQLHSEQVRKVRTYYGPILARIFNYLSDEFGSGMDGDFIAMENTFRDFNKLVTPEQLPMARQIIRELLNQTSSVYEGEELSHWNWLRVIYGRHLNLVSNTPSFRDFMGPEINKDFFALENGIFKNKKSFKYEILIDKAAIGAGTNTGLKFGIEGVAISIDKSRVGNPENTVSINLVGGLVQGGAGLDLKTVRDNYKLNDSLKGELKLPAGIESGQVPSPTVPEIKSVSLGTGSSRKIVFSEYDYSEESLAGPVMVYGIGLEAGISSTVVKAAVKSGGSIFVFYGNGSLPPFVIPSPLKIPTESTESFLIPTSYRDSSSGKIKQSFWKSVSWPKISGSFGIGVVGSASAVTAGQLSLSTEIVRKNFDAAVGLTAVVHFDGRAVELRSFGWSSLRYLVAELRAIFEAESGAVSVLGFSDAAETGVMVSQDGGQSIPLSQARANAVKEALVLLVGDGLAIPEERFRAVGLGSEPSLGQASPAEATMTEPELQVLEDLKSTLPVLAPGASDEDWRRVVIILNSLLTIDLQAPGQ